MCRNMDMSNVVEGSGICMGFNITLIDGLKMLVVVILVIVFFIPKKKEYEYNSLDKKSVIFNVILSIIYVPFSIMGVFTIFFADAPAEINSSLKNLLIDIIIWLGFSIPLLSAASIFTSVLARKRGKSKFSFIIQFLPIPVFVVMLILMFFMDRA